MLKMTRILWLWSMGIALIPLVASAAVNPEPMVLSEAILCERASVTLSEHEKPKLDRIIAYIEAHAGQITQTLLEGFGDDQISIEEQLAFGQRRAQAVKRYLERHVTVPLKIHVISGDHESPACAGPLHACVQKHSQVWVLLEFIADSHGDFSASRDPLAAPC